MHSHPMRKAQVLLSANQYELVRQYAREHGTNVSSVLRETLERTLLATLEQRRRQTALRRLIEQELPVADWPQIEVEIEARWHTHEPE